MSQLDPLPSDLPFKIVSKTVGRGAYASIKKATPLPDPSHVFAVKFIHKAYAVKHGRITAKQIAMEVSLHSHCGKHDNIIQFLATGEDPVWRWIAMEYAEGGDLFDKIEADVGVPEDIAHFYFMQLVSGISFVHSKGVAHRDIKPENMLLSANGNLKIADFGLATLYEYHGKQKMSATMCGSPPYIAPEVLVSGQGRGYLANLVDIWSCGVVLFVLLAGNTPWDEPSKSSWEFENYVRNSGRSEDELWEKLPKDALSLLRGMMKIDSATRFSWEDVRRHPWVTRPNSYLNSKGQMENAVSLATKMLESLKIDFSNEPVQSMEAEGQDFGAASTQPEAQAIDPLAEWEAPERDVRSASQPVTMNTVAPRSSWQEFTEDPTMSQFTRTPGVPISLTQRAQKFRDILPAQSLTKFYSRLPPNHLVSLLSTALNRLGIPVQFNPGTDSAWAKIKTLDGRKGVLAGDIVIERANLLGDLDGQELLEIRFSKIKGDPLEWRRFFKKVVVLCKDGVWVPDDMY